MSRYSKQQEYRLKKRLEKIECVEVLEYYGSRRKNKGDFLISVKVRNGEPLRYRIDHKSTENDRSIRFELEWLDRLYVISNNEVDEDGLTIPLVTFNFYRCRSIYVAKLTGHGLLRDRTEKSVTLFREELEDFVATGNFGDPRFKGSESLWIRPLEYFFEVYVHL